MSAFPPGWFRRFIGRIWHTCHPPDAAGSRGALWRCPRCGTLWTWQLSIVGVGFCTDYDWRWLRED